MTTVLFICGEDCTALINELKNDPNFDLRVRSNAAEVTENDLSDAAVTVSDTPIKGAKKLLLILNDADGSEAEAGDFILRPVRFSELKARINRLLSRSAPAFTSGELTIDLESASVTVNGEQVHLTLIEYRLLSLLAKNHGRCVSYKEILSALWESPIGSEMLSVRVFVNAIRRKFASAGAMVEHIVTHASKGYELI